MDQLNASGLKFSDDWKPLYKISGIMAIAIVILIPIQILLFITWPPPDNALDFFDLFNKNWLLGLLSLDLLYLINNILLIFVYLGLYMSLRPASPVYMLIALILGLIGIATYYSSSVAFEMLSLSKQFSNTGNAEFRLQLLTVGKMILETYKGTAFDVYYVLNAITLLILSGVMLNAKIFSRSTAIWGLISGILMLVPTTAGSVGLILGIASLIPWSIFSILIAKKFFSLGK